jgi:iron complex outermembrane receptor protein
MGKFRKAAWAWAALVTMAVGAGAAAQPSEEDDLAQVYGDKSVATIGSGWPLPLARAPSIATVITAEDIRALGATDLDDVLRTVPGLSVMRLANYANKPVWMVRGIASQHNPQVLLLINGIPMTSIYLGDRGDVWGGMPLENVARIEVIRGPGSALYGADAFAGVVNVLTKTAAHIDGLHLGLRRSSFDSSDGWLQYGGRAGGWELAASLQAGRTAGPRNRIEADAQTANDAIFGTRVSHAPGPLQLRRQGFDAALDLSREAWRFRAAYKRRDDVGHGAGIASALDPEGRSFHDRFTADVTYHEPRATEHWDVTAQASWFSTETRSHVVLFPPGTVLLGPFPEGMVGNPAKWERHARFNASAFYTGLAGHRLRLGAGAAREEIYRVRDAQNFVFVFVPGVGNVPMPLGRVVDTSDTAPFLTPHLRNSWFGYLQDEWRLARDWTLTTGVRHDRYSDFGGTTNPRLALVWEAALDWTAKLLYGQAFRAPTFGEKYFINNPVLLGNPDVKPERIATVEAALAWQPKGGFALSLNVYRYVMKDILRHVPNADPTTGATAQNSGRQVGRGLELEADWDVSRRLRLSVNLAVQRSVDEASGKGAGIAPRREIDLRADWRLPADWLLNGQVHRVEGRRREPGDARPPIADYTTVDLGLRLAPTGRRWDLAFTVRNLFDADAREPSFAPGSIPFDFPMPGRNFQLQLGFRL